MAKKIRHINADLLSDKEMELFSDKLRDAEKRMDEKLADEIYHRDSGDNFVKDDSGIWVSKKYS